MKTSLGTTKGSYVNGTEYDVDENEGKAWVKANIADGLTPEDEAPKVKAEPKIEHKAEPKPQPKPPAKEVMVKAVSKPIEHQ